MPNFNNYTKYFNDTMTNLVTINVGVFGSDLDLYDIHKILFQN